MKKRTRWEQMWPCKDYMKYRLSEKLYGKHMDIQHMDRMDPKQLGDNREVQMWLPIPLPLL